MKKLYTPLLLLSCVMSLGSCKLAYRTLLGVDSTPAWYSNADIEKKAKKYNIPESQLYALDTASYQQHVVEDYKQKVKHLLTQEPIDSAQVKLLNTVLNNDLQSTQIRYFDAQGKPTFKLVNCYIDPPIPMNWNVEGSFDQFPPQNPIPELQVNQPLSFLLPHFKTMNGDQISFSQLPAADYYAVIYWNSFMIRPSKKLLKTIHKYHLKHPDKKVHVLYVNNQNASIWSSTTAEQKIELKAEIEKEKKKTKKK
jgi:hypothetical protein